MLEPQSSLSTTTEKVKHQLIELLAWLEEPHSEGVIKLLIEDFHFLFLGCLKTL